MIEIVGPEYENNWLQWLSDKDYHADGSAINASGLKVFAKSPEHFYSECILKEKEKADTTSLRFGRIVHLALLQPKKFFEEVKVMPEFGDLRSQVNRTKKAEWVASQAPGSEFISKDERKHLVKMIESFQRNSYAVQLLEGAEFEISGYFRDPVTGLKCRIRPDILRRDLSAMPDLKTTQDASPGAFSRQCWVYKYYLQLAFYSFGVQCIAGKKPELPCFIAIEKEPPYSCVVYAADEGMMDRGTQEVRKLLDRLAVCISENKWPGYFSDGVGSLSLPAWTDWSVEI